MLEEAKKMLKPMYEKVSEIVPNVFLVGGSCRDAVLGIKPHDYDFTSPLLPDEIEAHIKSTLNEQGHTRKVNAVGKSFGCLKFKVMGHIIDMTTFRGEKYFPKDSKPEVTFSKTLIEDLERRDFTINTISFDGNGFIDPLNGIQDLKDKKLKCVGNATIRFKDDPARLMRGARLIAKLNLVPDEALVKSAKKTSHRILYVSKNRWTEELDKLLMLDNPKKGLDFLIEIGVLKYIIPELQLQYKFDQNSPLYHKLDLWEHTSTGLNYLAKQNVDLETRWSFLMHDIAKPFCKITKFNKILQKNVFGFHQHDLLGCEIVKSIGNRLKWSKDRIKNVSEMVLNHMKDCSPLKEADMNSKGF